MVTVVDVMPVLPEGAKSSTVSATATRTKESVKKEFSGGGKSMAVAKDSSSRRKHRHHVHHRHHRQHHQHESKDRRTSSADVREKDAKGTKRGSHRGGSAGAGATRKIRVWRSESRGSRDRAHERVKRRRRSIDSSSYGKSYESEIDRRRYSSSHRHKSGRTERRSEFKETREEKFRDHKKHQDKEKYRHVRASSKDSTRHKDSNEGKIETRRSSKHNQGESKTGKSTKRSGPYIDVKSRKGSGVNKKRSRSSRSWQSSTDYQRKERKRKSESFSSGSYDRTSKYASRSKSVSQRQRKGHSRYESESTARTYSSEEDETYRSSRKSDRGKEQRRRRFISKESSKPSKRESSHTERKRSEPEIKTYSSKYSTKTPGSRGKLKKSQSRHRSVSRARSSSSETEKETGEKQSSRSKTREKKQSTEGSEKQDVSKSAPVDTSKPSSKENIDLDSDHSTLSIVVRRRKKESKEHPSHGDFDEGTSKSKHRIRQPSEESLPHSDKSVQATTKKSRGLSSERLPPSTQKPSDVGSIGKKFRQLSREHQRRSESTQESLSDSSVGEAKTSNQKSKYSKTKTHGRTPKESTKPSESSKKTDKSRTTATGTKDRESSTKSLKIPHKPYGGTKKSSQRSREPSAESDESVRIPYAKSEKSSLQKKDQEKDDSQPSPPKSSHGTRRRLSKDSSVVWSLLSGKKSKTQVLVDEEENDVSDTSESGAEKSGTKTGERHQEVSKSATTEKDDKKVGTDDTTRAKEKKPSTKASHVSTVPKPERSHKGIHGTPSKKTSDEEAKMGSEETTVPTQESIEYSLKSLSVPKSSMTKDSTKGKPGKEELEGKVAKDPSQGTSKKKASSDGKEQDQVKPIEIEMTDEDDNLPDSSNKKVGTDDKTKAHGREVPVEIRKEKKTSHPQKGNLHSEKEKTTDSKKSEIKTTVKPEEKTEKSVEVPSQAKTGSRKLKYPTQREADDTNMKDTSSLGNTSRVQSSVGPTVKDDTKRTNVRSKTSEEGTRRKYGLETQTKSLTSKDSRHAEPTTKETTTTAEKSHHVNEKKEPEVDNKNTSTARKEPTIAPKRTSGFDFAKTKKSSTKQTKGSTNEPKDSEKQTESNKPSVLPEKEETTKSAIIPKEKTVESKDLPLDASKISSTKDDNRSDKTTEDKKKKTEKSTSITTKNSSLPQHTKNAPGEMQPQKKSRAKSKDEKSIPTKESAHQLGIDKSETSIKSAPSPPSQSNAEEASVIKEPEETAHITEELPKDDSEKQIRQLNDTLGTHATKRDKSAKKSPSDDQVGKTKKTSSVGEQDPGKLGQGRKPKEKSPTIEHVHRPREKVDEQEKTQDPKKNSKNYVGPAKIIKTRKTQTAPPIASDTTQTDLIEGVNRGASTRGSDTDAGSERRARKKKKVNKRKRSVPSKSHSKNRKAKETLPKKDTERDLDEKSDKFTIDSVAGDHKKSVKSSLPRPEPKSNEGTMTTLDMGSQVRAVKKKKKPATKVPELKSSEGTMTTANMGNQVKAVKKRTKPSKQIPELKSTAGTMTTADMGSQVNTVKKREKPSKKTPELQSNEGTMTTADMGSQVKAVKKRKKKENKTPSPKRTERTVTSADVGSQAKAAASDTSTMTVKKRNRKTRKTSISKKPRSKSRDDTKTKKPVDAKKKPAEERKKPPKTVKKETKPEKKRSTKVLGVKTKKSKEKPAAKKNSSRDGKVKQKTKKPRESKDTAEKKKAKKPPSKPKAVKEKDKRGKTHTTPTKKSGKEREARKKKKEHPKNADAKRKTKVAKKLEDTNVHIAKYRSTVASTGSATLTGPPGRSDSSFVTYVVTIMIYLFGLTLLPYADTKEVKYLWWPVYFLLFSGIVSVLLRTQMTHHEIVFVA